jgi:hypothetical protein
MSTIEVVPVTGGSARLGVFSRDHCPPHATCRDIAGRWTVRLTFSFADDRVGVKDVLPPQNSPGASVINDLAYAVQQRLPECRRLWWAYRQANPAAMADGACCLNNQLRAGGTISHANYDPATCTVYLRFAEGNSMSYVL